MSMLLGSKLRCAISHAFSFQGQNAERSSFFREQNLRKLCSQEDFYPVFLFSHSMHIQWRAEDVKQQKDRHYG